MKKRDNQSSLKGPLKINPNSSNDVAAIEKKREVYIGTGTSIYFRPNFHRGRQRKHKKA